MVFRNTNDFIDPPLPKHFVSAHGTSHHAWAPGKGVRKGGLGVKPPHELDILQYLYYLRKGN